MSFFDVPPKNANAKITRFEISVPDQDLSELQQLIKLSKVGPKTYENLQSDRSFGITRQWLSDARDAWTHFDWRACEQKINKNYPQFVGKVTDAEGTEHDIHFVALLSKKSDAIPLVLLHGWPGSFLEFLPILSILKEKYTPEDLPYNVIVPSLPGYAFSSRPPLDKDYGLKNVGYVLNQLVVELGYGDAYVVQGGDIGSRVGRVMGVEFEGCKAVHLNFCHMAPPQDIDEASVTQAEKEGVQRAQAWMAKGTAYAMEHGTRPATIGLVLSSSPIALLAWIGEKFLAWTDKDPSLDTILESVTLYWLTSTFPTSIYPYRWDTVPNSAGKHDAPDYYLKKPLGYSYFPCEVYPVPKAWVETTGNLIFSRLHDSGGHFAALEKPEVLLDDVEAFISQVWKK